MKLSTNFSTLYSEYCRSLNIKDLDPSLCFGFSLKTKFEFENLKNWLNNQKIKPFSIVDSRFSEPNVDFF